MKTNNLKTVAGDFLRQVASGKINEAYASHVSPTFRHHNPYFPSDAESLKRGMEENARKNPNKVFEIKHTLQDGDFVAVHSRVRQHPQDRGAAVVHLFRFHQGRIEELWDIGQSEPEEMTNENGMF